MKPSFFFGKVGTEAKMPHEYCVCSWWRNPLTIQTFPDSQKLYKKIGQWKNRREGLSTASKQISVSELKAPHSFLLVDI